MSGRADVVGGTAGASPLAVPEEPGSGVGPASNLKGLRVLMNAWPLKSYLELGALPDAVPCARLHAKQLLWEWGLADYTEVVELVVSELVTNAVQASKRLVGSRYNGRWIPGVPPVRLWLRSDKQRVLIQVWDGNHRMPQRQEVEDLEAEGGRGLLLVESLGAEWGAYVVEGGTGKVVWAICAKARASSI
jgi:anti-sigma regulatory factor (Ser/Thr protein kinase)